MKKGLFLLYFLINTIAYGQQVAVNKEIKLPNPVGWVNDFESIFTAPQEKALDSLLTAYEKLTTREVVVITIPSSAITAKKFTDFTLKIAQQWEIGKKDKNNGVLIAISKELRKIQIETGLGTEKMISDAKIKTLIDSVFIPYFKQGDFYKGTYKGIIQLTKIWDQY